MDILEVGGVSLLIAFAAGLLSVASPCVLPLVPAYLGYLTGTALEGSPSGQTVAAAGAGGGGGSVAIASTPPPDDTPSPFLHSIAFVGGFFVIFILFGILTVPGGRVGLFLCCCLFGCLLRSLRRQLGRVAWVEEPGRSGQRGYEFQV